MLADASSSVDSPFVSNRTSSDEALRRLWEATAACLGRGLPRVRDFEPSLGHGRHYGPPPYDARPAAVAVLAYPHEGRIVVPLTLRQAALSSHAGQISLPGGRIESGESDSDAAMRELCEELGVGCRHALAMASMTPLYIFGSNFHIRPWLAWAARRPAFVVNSAEVAELFEVGLDELCDARNWSTHRRITRGIEHEVPHIAWRQHCIWGATAMILGELIAAYRRARTELETAS